MKPLDVIVTTSFKSVIASGTVSNISIYPWKFRQRLSVQKVLLYGESATATFESIFRTHFCLALIRLESDQLFGQVHKCVFIFPLPWSKTVNWSQNWVYALREQHILDEFLWPFTISILVLTSHFSIQFKSNKVVQVFKLIFWNALHLSETTFTIILIKL